MNDNSINEDIVFITKDVVIIQISINNSEVYSHSVTLHPFKAEDLVEQISGEVLKAVNASKNIQRAGSVTV